MTNTALFQQAPDTDEHRHAYRCSSVEPLDESTNSAGRPESRRASVKWSEKLELVFGTKTYSD